MKKIAIVAMAAAGFVVPVLAADFPVVPYTKAPAMVAAIYDWGGFYIGANGGWSWDRKCWGLANNNGIALASPVDIGCNSGNGGVAGGQIGYRWPASSWV